MAKRRQRSKITIQEKESDYKADLFADLRSHEYAAGYVSAAAHESPEALFLALRDVEDSKVVGK